MEYLPVSVIIPSFNSGDYLIPCVESINQSTRQPAEIIIIDDCSTDQSVDVAATLQHRFDNVRVIRREVNGGIAAARKTGVVAAAHDTIAIVDADDLIDDDAIGDALDAMLAAGADMCIWEIWTLEGAKQTKMAANPASLPVSGQAAVVMTLGTWGIHPLGLAKKQLYLDAYAAEFPPVSNSDELATRLVFNGAGMVAGSRKRYLYRQHAASMTKSPARRNERRVDRVRSGLWLLEFAKGIQGAPTRKLSLDALWSVKELWLNRQEGAAGAAGLIVRECLPQILSTSSAWRWLWRYPKYAAFAAYMTARMRLPW